MFKSRSFSPLAIVFIAIAIEVMGGGLLIPVLPFLVQQYRSDALTIGLLSASFSAAQFFAAPVLGSLSDRIGRRPILILCTFGTAISFYLFGFAQALWVMFIAQIANGITGGLISTAQAYIADVSETPEARTKNFGLIGAAFGIGFILGPLLGGTLSGISLKLPVFLAGTIALANALFAYFCLPESLKQKQPNTLSVQDFNPVGQLIGLLQRPQLQRLLLGYFLFFLAFAGFTSIFVISLRDRFALGPVFSGSVLFWVGVIASFVQGYLIRQWLPKFGEFRLTIMGFSMAALAYVFITLIPNGYYLFGTQTLFAFGLGIASPSIRGIISQSVSDAEQGKVSGGTLSLTSLTQMLGPLLAGWSYDAIHPVAPFMIGAILSAVAVGAIASAKSTLRPNLSMES